MLREGLSRKFVWSRQIFHERRFLARDVVPLHDEGLVVFDVVHDAVDERVSVEFFLLAEQAPQDFHCPRHAAREHAPGSQLLHAVKNAVHVGKVRLEHFSLSQANEADEKVAHLFPDALLVETRSWGISRGNDPLLPRAMRAGSRSYWRQILWG